MIKKRMKNLMNKIEKNAEGINEKDVQKLINAIINTKRIFVTGAGRSGYVVKAFAMRLMHISSEIYVVGETTTPSIHEDDLLIAVSGSGETASTVQIASVAKKKGAKIAVITSKPKSSIGNFADVIVKIKGRIDGRKKRDYLVRQMLGTHELMVPLGTLFELTTMFFLDTVIEELIVLQKKTEKEMKKRHTNLE